MQLGALRLRNRVLMAPMTRECAPDGIPTAQMAAYYARRAAGGTALLISEGIAVCDEGAFGASVPRLDGAAVAAWRAVVEGVQQQGAAMLAQLWHVGAFDPSLIAMQDSLVLPVARVSPSGLAAPGRALGRAMTTADIDRTVAAFAQAAAGARAAGFDGVEIHGAHGYLPDQFLWHGTNLRSDRYGGALRNRVRFACEVVAAVRETLGAAATISFRLSQWKQLDYGARIAQTPQELAVVVEALAEAGVDVFHGSTRRYWEPAFAGDALGFAGWLRKLSGRPAIAVGSVTLANDFKSADGKTLASPAPQQIDDLERRLAADEFDLIAIGRALLANPDWVAIVSAGRAKDLEPFSKAHLDQLL